MGKITGFLEVERRDRGYAPPAERLKHWNEFVEQPAPEAVSRQASRCMDCGIPFCHAGCPVNNLIPDWNDLVYKDDWQRALARLHETNNFPEFTGRVCTAPCEAACTLNITDSPVTTRGASAAVAGMRTTFDRRVTCRARAHWCAAADASRVSPGST